MSDDEDDEFGTDPHKLRRSDGPDTSKAAAHTVDTAQFEELAYDIHLEHGIEGCILAELRDRFAERAPPVALYGAAARRTGIHQKGMVLRTPLVRRAGNSGRMQHVYIARQLMPLEWVQDLKDRYGWLNPCLFSKDEEVPLDPDSKEAIIRDLANDLATARLELLTESGERTTTIGQPLDTEDSALGRACKLFRKPIPIIPDWGVELELL